MIVFGSYSFSFKAGNQRYFRDGKLPVLLDITQSEYNDYLNGCQEIRPDEIYSLPQGTLITYIRRDNHNIVRDVVIDRQDVSKDGNPFTRVILPHGPSYVSKAAARRKSMYASPMRYALNHDVLARLFIVQNGDFTSHKIEKLEQKIKSLEEMNVKLQTALRSLIVSAKRV